MSRSFLVLVFWAAAVNRKERGCSCFKHFVTVFFFFFIHHIDLGRTGTLINHTFFSPKKVINLIGSAKKAQRQDNYTKIQNQRQKLCIINGCYSISYNCPPTPIRAIQINKNARNTTENIKQKPFSKWQR